MVSEPSEGHLRIAAWQGRCVDGDLDANVVGKDSVRPGSLGYGDTAIFDPRGVAIAEAGLFREQLIVADIYPTAAIRSGVARRDELPDRVREQLADEPRQYQRSDETRAPEGEDRGGSV